MMQFRNFIPEKHFYFNLTKKGDIMNKLTIFVCNLVVVCMIVSVGFAQNRISYQGKLFHNQEPVNATINMKFFIETWEETQDVVIEDGLYTVVLGDVVAIPDNIFNADELTLQISIEDNLIETVILPVPVAVRAKISDNSKRIAGNPVTGSPQVNQVLKFNGSSWVSSTDEVGIQEEIDPVWSVVANDYYKKNELAKVATSGDYNDLSNKPEFPDTSNFVTLTGSQTIDSYKKFNEYVQFMKGFQVVGQVSGDLDVGNSISIGEGKYVNISSFSGGGLITVRRDGNQVGYLAAEGNYGIITLCRDTSYGLGAVLKGNTSSSEGSMLELYNSNGTNTIKLVANDGKGYAKNGWFQLSDKLLKQNIQTISGATDMIIKLRGVYFEWKDKNTFSDGQQVGFIAQEVNKVIPSIVSKNDEYYTVDYSRITPLLVESIKEQQKQILALKADIEGLKMIIQKNANEAIVTN